MTETFGHSPGSEHLSPRVTTSDTTSSSAEDLATTLGTNDTLGAALCKQGKYDDAVLLLKEVLEKREALGQSKADTDMLRTMNNLAAALKGQGYLAEAEALHREVLEMYEKILGSEHTNTITSINNLASVLARQGNFDEAAKMQQRAFALSRNVRGPQHPGTLTIMANLVDILGHQQKHEQAENISREIQALSERVPREHHPEQVTSVNNPVSRLGERREAEELHSQASTLGQTDVEEIDPVGALVSQGRYDEAELLLQNEVKSSTEALGGDSSRTRSSKRKLADVLIRNGKSAEAEHVLRSVLVTASA